MEIHVYVYQNSSVSGDALAKAVKPLADQLTALIQLVTAQGAQMERLFAMADKTLDDIVADVAKETTLASSVSTMVTAILAKAAAVPGLTPAQQTQINAIAADVEANNATFAAAVAQGTPAAAVNPTASGTTTGSTGPV